LLPQSGGEAPRFAQVIEADALSADESVQPNGRLPLNFADVRWVNTELTGKSTLRGPGAVVKARLPDQELYDPAFPIGA